MIDGIYKHRRSSTKGASPDASNFENSEIGINHADQCLYTKNDSGVVYKISAKNIREIQTDYTATEGQTDFTISGVYESEYLSIFSEGVKVRNTEYSVSNDGTNTKITFNQGRNSEEWIQIVRYTV